MKRNVNLIQRVQMRTGKLHDTTKVLIPYFDTEGTRHYSMLVITGTLYASKLYSGIKDFVKQNFGIEVDKDWLAHVPLIVNQNDPELRVSAEERNKLIENFIDAMELKDEVEDNADTGSEAEDAAKADEPLLTVPDTDNGK